MESTTNYKDQFMLERALGAHRIIRCGLERLYKEEPRDSAEFLQWFGDIENDDTETPLQTILDNAYPKYLAYMLSVLGSPHK